MSFLKALIAEKTGTENDQFLGNFCQDFGCRLDSQWILNSQFRISIPGSGCQFLFRHIELNSFSLEFFILIINFFCEKVID